MLLNIGDVSSTMITIVFTSMEEAVMRAFLVEIDTYIRKIMGKPKLHGQTLELQRFVWSIDINQSSIAEFVAIIVSSFAYVLEPHALAINLDTSMARLCLGVLLLYSSCSSYFLKVLSTLLRSGQSQSMEYQSVHTFNIQSLYIRGYFTKLLRFQVFFIPYAFARFPTTLSCSSDFICDCIDQPVYFEWYNETCASLPANITFAAQNISGVNHCGLKFVIVSRAEYHP